MNIGSFSMRDVHPVCIRSESKMGRFVCEFEGQTTKEELDNFMMALNDGHVFFKRADEAEAEFWMSLLDIWDERHDPINPL